MVWHLRKTSSRKLGKMQCIRAKSLKVKEDLLDEIKGTDMDDMNLEKVMNNMFQLNIFGMIKREWERNSYYVGWKRNMFSQGERIKKRRQEDIGNSTGNRRVRNVLKDWSTWKNWNVHLYSDRIIIQNPWVQ